MLEVVLGIALVAVAGEVATAFYMHRVRHYQELIRDQERALFRRLEELTIEIRRTGIVAGVCPICALPLDGQRHCRCCDQKWSTTLNSWLGLGYSCSGGSESGCNHLQAEEAARAGAAAVITWRQGDRG